MMLRCLSISRLSKCFSLYRIFIILILKNPLFYRAHLCGYDINLTYPQEGGYFPTLTALDDLDSVLDFDSSADTDTDLHSNSGLVSVSVSTSEGSSGTNSVNVSGRDSGSGLRNLTSVSDWESESGEMKSSFENEVDIADTLASESTSTGKSPTSNSNADRRRPSRRRSTDIRLSRRRRMELVATSTGSRCASGGKRSRRSCSANLARTRRESRTCVGRECHRGAESYEHTTAKPYLDQSCVRIIFAI